MFGAFKHSMMISSFVFIMLLLIEYINIQTQGRWQSNLKKNKWIQYLLGASFGAIPGCLGGFTVVSLYSHKIMTIGALVTTMIATSGDEAFVMFSLFPGKALLITGILFVIGLIAGFLTDLFVKNPYSLVKDLGHELQIHEKEECHCFPRGKLLSQLKNITFARALLIGLLLSFLFFIFTGNVGVNLWDWKFITFTFGSLLSLFIVSTVPDHFLEEHLWEHVLKKHLPRIFIWTFGTLLLLHYMNTYINIESWVQNNLIVVLMVAVMVGIIPESGPHLIFVTMYAGGSIPLSVLIASSIAQDGHAMLPLIAISKRSFIWVKLINMVVAFIIGYIGLNLF